MLSTSVTGCSESEESSDQDNISIDNLEIPDDDLGSDLSQIEDERCNDSISNINFQIKKINGQEVACIEFDGLYNYETGEMIELESSGPNYDESKHLSVTIDGDAKGILALNTKPKEAGRATRSLKPMLDILFVSSNNNYIGNIVGEAIPWLKDIEERLGADLRVAFTDKTFSNHCWPSKLSDIEALWNSDKSIFSSTSGQFGLQPLQFNDELADYFKTKYLQVYTYFQNISSSFIPHLTHYSYYFRAGASKYIILIEPATAINCGTSGGGSVIKSINLPSGVGGVVGGGNSGNNGINEDDWYSIYAGSFTPQGYEKWNHNHGVIHSILKQTKETCDNKDWDKIYQAFWTMASSYWACDERPWLISEYTGGDYIYNEPDSDENLVDKLNKLKISANPRGYYTLYIGNILKYRHNTSHEVTIQIEYTNGQNGQYKAVQKTFNVTF